MSSALGNSEPISCCYCGRPLGRVHFTKNRVRGDGGKVEEVEACDRIHLEYPAWVDGRLAQCAGCRKQKPKEDK